MIEYMYRPNPPPQGAWRLGIAVALGIFAVLVMVLAVSGWHPLHTLDAEVATGLHGSALAHPGPTGTARVLTDWVWDPWAFRLLLTVVVVRLWWRRERLLALWLAGTALVGSAVQQVLKAALGRERPRWREPVDSAEYAAMPSGHALTAALVCVLLLWLLRTRGAPAAGLWWSAAAVAGVSVGGVAFTRLWLGVHWLTDTVVGVALGAAIGLAATAGWTSLRQGAREAAHPEPQRRS